jgi:hypothetical protein
MNKEFIPYEQALELNELGFDEVCMAGYDGDDNSLYIGYISNEGVQYNPQYYTKAPLYQQAFRWFRDKKLSDGSVSRHGEADGGYSYRWDIVHEFGVYEERHFKKGYKTYEEAELACLKELIEIVKNK